VGGMDIDIDMEECMAGLRSMEFGGAMTYKYLHLVLKGDFSSLLVLNKKNEVCLGWMRVLRLVLLFQASG
jgi:hypothetical protein